MSDADDEIFLNEIYNQMAQALALEENGVHGHVVIHHKPGTDPEHWEVIITIPRGPALAAQKAIAEFDTLPRYS